MNKLWTVIKHEYTRHVLRKRFIFALISIPLWILIFIGITFLSVFIQTDSTPVGFVDQSGILSGVDFRV